ncbi:DUF3471 domain-containing protein [Spirosoma endophyticum]|nr:DUF3471 domain-containing protein [Spirosoma endophyticum]
MNQRVTQQTPLPLPLTAYTGTYTHPLYGTITIQADKGPQTNERLRVYFQHHPGLTAQLEYMDGQAFRLTFSNPRWGITAVNFRIANQQAEQVEIRVSDFVDAEPYLFRKQ